MIELKNIILTFPDGDTTITAVNDVSLTVESGKIAGITGPSGSGKSSLLAVASTLIKPDSGTLTINGTDALGLTRKEASKLRASSIGIVFQQANLISSLKSWEQLVAVAETEGVKQSERAKMRSKAMELLEATGLAGEVNKRPHQLSGGQRQRVNICRALMNDPSVLIVDEPTSALDQERGHEIIELIMKLTREKNTATLLVTHDRTHLPLMDDVITMVDGQVVIGKANDSEPENIR
jgi:putative ABC transport system ATP-binding protein